MAFTKLHSIYGRILGVSSSGGITSAVGATGGQSTAFVVAAQMWGDGMVETVSSAGAAIRNVGITIVSSGSTSGTTPFIVGQPVKGVYKEIHFQTPATASAINTSATTIYFNSTLAEAAAGGSTALTVVGTSLGIGGVIALRGLSTAQWGIVSHTVNITS